MKNLAEFISKKPLLFSICFFEGATVMVVELLAGHFLNLHFGNSIVLWSSVLSVSLLALSLGYFVGGKLSDKKINISILLSLFFISGFLFLINFVNKYIIILIAEGNGVFAEYLSSFLLIFPILFFCAIISPLLIKELKNNFFSPGKAASIIFAVSTFSGIISTFLSGFYLIPNKGLKFTSVFFGSLLLINFLIFLLRPIKRS